MMMSNKYYKRTVDILPFFLLFLITILIIFQLISMSHKDIYSINNMF